ncbi:MAG TPA: urate hydroxylase PuuD [Longimicrobiales bacterium]|nr:urate hydroxylase PuuD [Longimicrobiales bacterium]
MSETLRELLDLLLRWVHVIAAIMWIGNSLLFNWLDRTLRPAARPQQASQGETWLLHSGGFYQVEKTISPSIGMPRPLHWFKWQAYTTWLSGAALLIVVYWMSGTAMLVGAGSTMSDTQAVLLGAGVIVGGWLVYEALLRTPLARAAPPIGALVGLALVLALAWWLTRVFTGRAAFLHIGALLGTLMAANVVFGIMPAQRALIASVESGAPPDTASSERAKLRSIHNNYFTFPVIALMLSSHFPSLYQGDAGWLRLGVLVLLGAGARHVLNVRYTYRGWKPALGAVIVLGTGALWLLVSRPGAGSGADPERTGVVAGPVSFGTVEAIIGKRCTVCHSASPAIRTFGAPPVGVEFDTPEQIRRLAPRIHARAVETETMPPGNATFMTDDEREILGRWTAGDAADGSRSN